MVEADVEIDGVRLNFAQSMTLRVAVSSFLMSCASEGSGLGEIGKLYAIRSREILGLIHNETTGEDFESRLKLSQNTFVAVFPFFTVDHFEVILRHGDEEFQSIEMTPDEADQLAVKLRAAARCVRQLHADEEKGKV